MTKPSMKTGDWFTHEIFGRYKIVEYRHSSEVLIRFKNTGFEYWTRSSEIRTGQIKDRLQRSIFGIGYHGEGPFVAHIGRRATKEHQLWKGVLGRHQNLEGLNPTYADVTVYEKWHNFQEFAAFVTKLPNFGRKGFELDKDLKVLGSRRYSPKTVSFVPKVVNLAVNVHDKNPTFGVRYNKRTNDFSMVCYTGRKKNRFDRFATREQAIKVFWRTKCLYVRELAEKHRKRLDPVVYENLSNLTVKQLRALNGL